MKVSVEKEFEANQLNVLTNQFASAAHESTNGLTNLNFKRFRQKPTVGHLRDHISK